MDVNNIPGLDRVDRLAEYLVGLRNQTSLALSNQDVSSIVGMWEDRCPTTSRRWSFLHGTRTGCSLGDSGRPRKRLSSRLVWRVSGGAP